MRDPARSHSIRHRSITETAEATVCWCSTHAGLYVGRRWRALAFSARRERRRGQNARGRQRLPACCVPRPTGSISPSSTCYTRGTRATSWVTSVGPVAGRLVGRGGCPQAPARSRRACRRCPARSAQSRRLRQSMRQRTLLPAGVHPDTAMADVAALVALGARCLRFSATQPGAHQITTGNARKGEQHWVAVRAGKPCLRCGTSVRVRAEVPNNPGRRRTWWCPHCQPMRPCG